jgi:hypothetical protein
MRREGWETLVRIALGRFARFANGIKDLESHVSHWNLSKRYGVVTVARDVDL